MNGINANDDSYRSDPGVICVGATRFNGRAAPYSNPGACLLVSAIGGEDAFYYFTTDRQGASGYSAFQTFTDPNFWNYTFSPFGFKGTSASAPQISGLAALVLSANPNLTYRDVQQILLLSSRHFDFADPDVIANGAGLLVSHNVGYGLPDAGEAVRLARNWSNRPPLTNVNFNSSNVISINDAGLRVSVSGVDVPANIFSIVAVPGTGPHADAGTPWRMLVDVGLVTNTPNVNLTNKAALIQHGSSFADEITKAAQAGADFAIVYFNSDSGVPSAMVDTEFVPIPAVLIGQTSGVAIRNYLQTNAAAQAQITLDSAKYELTCTNALVCEQVGVRVSLSHPTRADLRITLTSPQGTKSVLQQVNGDTNAAPTDWTFWSTHHFFESSQGTWTVAVADEFPGATGSVQSVELIINGTAISDSDADGLDDNWEMTHLQTLGFGPKDDPDKDGYNNAREQVMKTAPLISVPLTLDYSRWSSSIGRISWPGSTNYNYELWMGTNVANLRLLTNVAGQFTETEYFVNAQPTAQFFRVVATPRP
jgi:subtilisin-like proprotein convertase family protein